MFEINGKIHYDDTEGFRIILEICQDLSEYYRSLIPSYYRAVKPRYPAHVTVVRPEKEIPPKIRYWGDYEGEEVAVIYDPYILNGNGYYWLNCWSKRLEEIREELGLPNTSKYSLRPPGFNKTFHTTIGKYHEVFYLEGNQPEA